MALQHLTALIGPYFAFSSQRVHGRRFLLSSVLSQCIFIYLAMRGYGLLSFFMINVGHDLISLGFSTFHDFIRDDLQRVHSKILRYRTPVWVVRFILAIFFSEGLICFAMSFAWVNYIVAGTTLIHYCMDDHIWRVGSPHRKTLQIQLN